MLAPVKIHLHMAHISGPNIAGGQVLFSSCQEFEMVLDVDLIPKWLYSKSKNCFRRIFTGISRIYIIGQLHIPI